MNTCAEPALVSLGKCRHTHTHTHTHTIVENMQKVETNQVKAASVEVFIIASWSANKIFVGVWFPNGNILKEFKLMIKKIVIILFIYILSSIKLINVSLDTNLHLISIYPTSPLRKDCNIRLISKQNTVILKSDLSFSKVGCLIRAKELSLVYYLLIDR